MNYSPAEFAEKLLGIVAGEVIAMKAALEVVATKIEKTAKSEFGTYQRASGKFPAWAPLTESTMEQKTKLGYAPPDNPLLREGDLRNSIKHEVKDFTAIIGSTSPIMHYHEFGTSKMAMRPVIGPAAFRNKKFIYKAIGAYVVSGFYGNGKSIHSSLGYNFSENEQV